MTMPLGCHTRTASIEPFRRIGTSQEEQEQEQERAHQFKVRTRPPSVAEFACQDPPDRFGAAPFQQDDKNEGGTNRKREGPWTPG